MKKLLTFQDFKKTIYTLLFIFLCFILVSQIITFLMIHEFKNQIIEHDYQTAGYLLENYETVNQITIPKDELPKLFYGSRTNKDTNLGAEIFYGTGYNSEISFSHIPSLRNIYSRYTIILLIISISTFGILLISIIHYVQKLHQKLEQANDQIKKFLDGNEELSLDDDSVEVTSTLFHTINTMSASLKAHISTQKQSKELLKSTISDISHQLKTPIAAMRMYNEIITEENNNPDVVQKFAAKTDISLERMEILIKNMLLVTRLDVGMVPFEYKMHHICSLIQCIADEFETRTAKEQKKIVLEGLPHSMLYCDYDWLKEALSNIVKNALDHSNPIDLIKISWESTPIITKIIIEDTGNGIHPEDIHFIFKKFYRSRFSQDKQGAGLGLSLAKSIIEAHNGTILVESTLGVGTKFTIHFLTFQNCKIKYTL